MTIMPIKHAQYTIVDLYECLRYPPTESELRETETKLRIFKIICSVRCPQPLHGRGHGTRDMPFQSHVYSYIDHESK